MGNNGIIAAGSSELYWETDGDGMPVVLIHGMSTDLRMWDSQVAELARSYFVIRYDIRGLGRSPRPLAPYRMADDLSALLDHLNVPAAVLVGFSTGGAIALDLAARQPARVAALIAVGAIPPVEAAADSDLAAAERALDDLLSARDEARGRGDLAAAVDGDLDVWASCHRGQSRAQLADWCMANPYFHADADENELLGPITMEDLSEIAAPTLIVVGAEDVELARLWGQRLADTIPGSELRVIPGADHFVSSGQPAVFNETVREFLDRRAPPRD